MPETEISIFDQAITLRSTGDLGKLQGLRDEAKGAHESVFLKNLARRLFRSHQAGDMKQFCLDLQAAVDLGLEEDRPNDRFRDARTELAGLRQKYLPEALPIPVAQTGSASAESLVRPEVRARKLIDIVNTRVTEADGYRDNTSLVIGPENAGSFTEFIESLEFPGQISLTNVKMMRFRDGLSFGFQGLVERPGEKTSIVVMSRWSSDENFKAVISTAASDLATSKPSALTAEIEQSLSPDNLRSAIAGALNQQIPPNWQVADFVVENGNLFLNFKKRESPLLATAAPAETPPWSTEWKDSGLWEHLAYRLGHRDFIEEILGDTGLTEDQVRTFEAALRSGDPTVPVDPRWSFVRAQLSNDGNDKLYEYWSERYGGLYPSQLTEEQKREFVEEVLPDFLRRYPREVLAPDTSEFGLSLGTAVGAGERGRLEAAAPALETAELTKLFEQLSRGYAIEPRPEVSLAVLNEIYAKKQTFIDDTETRLSTVLGLSDDDSSATYLRERQRTNALQEQDHSVVDKLVRSLQGQENQALFAKNPEVQQAFRECQEASEYRSIDSNHYHNEITRLLRLINDQVNPGYEDEHSRLDQARVEEDKVFTRFIQLPHKYIDQLPAAFASHNRARTAFRRHINDRNQRTIEFLLGAAQGAGIQLDASLLESLRRAGVEETAVTEEDLAGELQRIAGTTDITPERLAELLQQYQAERRPREE